MSIERSRNRFRASGPTSLRPEGISRRVASAARDRQLGPLPEQRPSGWHLLVFDNPARSADLERTPSPEPEMDPPERADDPSGPDGPTTAEPLPATHRAADPHRTQVGRVLDSRPDRGRRWTAAVIAAVGAAAGVGAVLLVTARATHPDPAPGPTDPTAISSTVPTAPVARTTAESAAPAISVIAPTPGPSSTDPGAAVVSTLTAGDPGFGWPATAFGSAPG